MRTSRSARTSRKNATNAYRILVPARGGINRSASPGSAPRLRIYRLIGVVDADKGDRLGGPILQKTSCRQRFGRMGGVGGERILRCGSPIAAGCEFEDSSAQACRRCGVTLGVAERRFGREDIGSFGIESGCGFERGASAAQVLLRLLVGGLRKECVDFGLYGVESAGVVCEEGLGGEPTDDGQAKRQRRQPMRDGERRDPATGDPDVDADGEEDGEQKTEPLAANGHEGGAGDDEVQQDGEGTGHEVD